MAITHSVYLITVLPDLTMTSIRIIASEKSHQPLTIIMGQHLLTTADLRLLAVRDQPPIMKDIVYLLLLQSCNDGMRGFTGPKSTEVLLGRVEDEVYLFP